MTREDSAWRQRGSRALFVPGMTNLVDDLDDLVLVIMATPGAPFRAQLAPQKCGLKRHLGRAGAVGQGASCAAIWAAGLACRTKSTPGKEMWFSKRVCLRWGPWAFKLNENLPRPTENARPRIRVDSFRT